MSTEDKAKEELAKLGQKALETTEKAGGWVDHVFGEGFRHVGASFAHSMAGFRVRNRLRVLKKTQNAIDASGMSGDTRPLDPRVGVPLLEAIADESNETLQDVWAAYIRNAVDPKMPHPDRLLIDVIRRFEPGDWSIIKKLCTSPLEETNSEKLEVQSDDLEHTMDRLAALGLFAYDDPKSAFIVAGGHFQEALKVRIGEAVYYENKLFRRLVSATSTE
ncbi:Abi-alpha family protein [Rhizobium herbae]